MKKILMSLTLLGTFAAMSAKGDSYMYWMVENAKYSNGESILFDTADIYAVGGAGAPILLGESSLNSDGSSTPKNVTLDVSGYTGSEWSFIVELYNDGKLLTQSAEGVNTYSSAFDAGAIFEHLAPSGAGVVKFSTFAVPEPTSGLLMLFGLCGLALRRKRA